MSTAARLKLASERGPRRRRWTRLVSLAKARGRPPPCGDPPGAASGLLRGGRAVRGVRRASAGAQPSPEDPASTPGWWPGAGRATAFSIGARCPRTRCRRRCSAELDQDAEPMPEPLSGAHRRHPRAAATSARLASSRKTPSRDQRHIRRRSARQATYLDAVLEHDRRRHRRAAFRRAPGTFSRSGPGSGTLLSQPSPERFEHATGIDNSSRSMLAMAASARR